MNRLRRLQDAGVSIWLDTLSRELLESGDFAALVEESAVTGATSNPTIFAKAITGSDRYDEQLRSLVAAGVREAESSSSPSRSTTSAAPQRSCARPTNAAAGATGSSRSSAPRTSPTTAEATIAQARRPLASARSPQRADQGRPRRCAGVVAIEELTARGVNVNVTLLFAVARYEEVIEAYLRGLERRVVAGLPVRAIASVASFFVSRIDGKADSRLGADSALRGRVAIANAHRAYARYLARFAGARWEALRARGARPQRPLWASTGTKDPSYSDVLYVERLIAARRDQHHAGARRCAPSPTTAMSS